jgi:uncharacterized protein GlcG (DUF336 family)
MTKRVCAVFALVAAAAALVGGSCTGGGGSGSGNSGEFNCDGACAQQALSVADVQTIVAQAVAEATLLGLDVTVAVTDRVGNVLAVFQTPGAAATTTVESGRNTGAGLDGLDVPAPAAAISKAGTGAYLSSQGNAFTTRTANQIVQENFNPGERLQAGGPLFGVQFSQLPCGDFVRRTSDGTVGPKRLPLGFAADPGGLPLYIQGVPVGGVGIEADGSYSGDLDIFDNDTNLEERIATAASSGFRAPKQRRADRISVNGRFLRFADDEAFRFTPADVLAFGALPGGLVDVAGFFAAAGGVLPGQQFLDPGSGVVSTTFVSAAFPAGQAAEILVDGMGVNRFPPIDSIAPAPGAGGLVAAEVTELTAYALDVAGRSRAQIRRPGGSSVRVNIAVVDIEGNIVGFARTPDAPVFGADVSLQKARTAAFFSKTTAAADLLAAAGPVGIITTVPPLATRTVPIADYVTRVRDFIPDPTALANGIAFSDRAGGNLSRPFFPDGANGNQNGPFSRTFTQWSPFGTGLQLDLVIDAILAALGGSAATTCTEASLAELPNGIQIFPGSVPIYRGSQLIGGIGISGDGVDQDDMVAFLGLHNAGVALGGAINNAPNAIRADVVSIKSDNLRYINCPPSPFLDSTNQSVCEGK